MKIYAVIDTNVLVSALLSRHPDTAVVMVVESLFSGQVIPLYDSEIIAEYREVLHREKFGLPEEKVDNIVDHIEKTGLLSSRVSSGEVFPDADDVVFYEVAISREGAYLVTGNARHFPKSARVVTPGEFLEILGGGR